MAFLQREGVCYLPNLTQSTVTRFLACKEQSPAGVPRSWEFNHEASLSSALSFRGMFSLCVKCLWKCDLRMFLRASELNLVQVLTKNFRFLDPSTGTGDQIWSPGDCTSDPRPCGFACVLRSGVLLLYPFGAFISFLFRSFLRSFHALCFTPFSCSGREGFGLLISLKWKVHVCITNIKKCKRLSSEELPLPGLSFRTLCSCKALCVTQLLTHSVSPQPSDVGAGVPIL